jgi:hypothetical protein
MPARRDRCGARTKTRRGPWRAACKPSSVASRCEHRSADGHPSARPTRELSESTSSDPKAGLRSPIRSCSGQSLPRFTPAQSCDSAGIVTVALVLASRRTGVTRWPALWSSDFPRTRPFDRCARGRPAASRDVHSTRFERPFDPASRASDPSGVGGNGTDSHQVSVMRPASPGTVISRPRWSPHGNSDASPGSPERNAHPMGVRTRRPPDPYGRGAPATTPRMASAMTW